MWISSDLDSLQSFAHLPHYLKILRILNLAFSIYKSYFSFTELLSFQTIMFEYLLKLALNLFQVQLFFGQTSANFLRKGAI